MLKMRRLVISVLGLLVPLMSFSQTVADRAVRYVESYSSLAVEEMYRSGVPASITLAQGMLESSYGGSVLAVEANNHFGIKCHSDWTGESIAVDDDAPGECFRKYPQAADSFRDHSDFLRYKPRYAFLFDYASDDYRSWAYGLKQAGYATDPEYPAKLTRLVETYHLDRFDTVRVEGTVLPETPSTLEQPVRSVVQGRLGTYTVSLKREILFLNGTPFVYARTGETYRSIAATYDLYPRELARFNDSSEPDLRLNAGEPVYLERKAKQAAAGLDKHICSNGESLRGISQKYAVELKSLMKLNGVTDKQMRMREDDTVLLRQLLLNAK